MTGIPARILRYYRRVHAVLDSTPDGLSVRESDHLTDARRIRAWHSTRTMRGLE